MLRLPKIADIFGLDPAKLKTDRSRGTVPLAGRSEGKNPAYGPMDLIALALHEQLMARNFTSSSAAREIMVSDVPHQVLQRLKEGTLSDCLLILSQEVQDHPKMSGVRYPMHRSDIISVSDLPEYVAKYAPRVGSFTVVALGPVWRHLVARSALAGVALYPDGEMIIEVSTE